MHAPWRPLVIAAAFTLLACGHKVIEAAVEAVSENEASCPSELRSVVTLASAEDASIFSRYLDVCKAMQVKPSADALIALQLGSERLTLRPSSDMPFGDLELRALVMLLEDNDGSKLQGLRHIDFSLCTLGPSGILLISNLLRHPKCELEHLDLDNQLVDRESLCSVFSALERSRSLRVLRMGYCHLGDEGGQIIVDFLANMSASSLEVLDIRNNFISFEVTSVIGKIAKRRHVRVQMEGNRVLDEVFNSASHCVGELLAIIGSVFLAKRVGCERPLSQVWSIVLYCAALNIMYLSSTLYHAFFALGKTTVYVFSILDYSGIFLLIAGSYSPFLGIVMYEECWATVLLAFMWSCAIIGICTAAFYTGPYSTQLRLSLYIMMGWTIVICIRPLMRKLGTFGTLLLFTGGVLYTGGTPFFVRGRRTLGVPDHTIWHMFVVGGTVAHYVCVYKCVLHDKEARSTTGSADVDDYMAVPLQPL